MDLRILACCAVGGHGGPVQSLLDVVENLPSLDWHLIGPFNAETLDRIAAVGASAHALDRPRGRALINAAQQVYSACKALSPHVIHANGLTEYAIALPASRRFRIPMVVWVHNWDVPRAAVWAPKVLGRPKTMRWCAVSSLAADLAQGAAGNAEVDIVPNPISTRVLAPASVAPRSDIVSIAYLGTDRPYKGFDLFVDTVASADPGEFRWVVASAPFATDSANWARLTALAETHSIDLIGRQRDVSLVYSDADVVYIPSRKESFCRVAAEAMLNEKPVVASALPPLVDLVGANSAGLTFPVGDVPRALQQLRSLRDSPEERARLGRNGRAFVEAALVPSKVAARLLAIYESA